MYMPVKAVLSTVLLAALTGATLVARGPVHHGDATNYTPEGAYGACGARSSNSDLVVALNPSAYNNGNNCWRHIGVSYNGNYVEATVVDLCPGCARYGIDLSPAAFTRLAPLEKGRIQVDWHFL
ncbi:RlpA-like double-psi beta-barrel-protein domain-containing protein-containing protein [Trametes elegans]|nr:RlpA-like double-psi beta-barrel-protein domain-containing protein-containing protein [Trametes elegans]